MPTNPAFKDHFSTASANYAAFRPTYPLALVDALADLCSGHQFALDCGCGSGQFSVLLTTRFAKVIATDASAAQIAQAQPHERVEYRVAPAEATGLAAASADLITVAQAAHWFDLEKFYAEVRRVARPGAVIALVAYGLHQIAGVDDRVILDFYNGTIGPYWPPERIHIERNYTDLPFPFAELPLPSLQMEVHWRRPELIGYLNTWSAVRAAEKALGYNPVVDFEPILSKSWPNSDEVRHITWPLIVRAGRI